VHIFKLERSGMSGERSTTYNNAGHKSGDENWMGYLKSTVANYLPYALPTQVTDVFTQGRAFASAMLPVAGIKHACAITTIQKSLR
jgi:autophagy-related protein 18